MIKHERELTAMLSSGLPVNPLPFATAVFNLVKENGSDWIKSDEGKLVLWVLNAQAYGCLATISLVDEWERLAKVARKISGEK